MLSTLFHSPLRVGPGGGVPLFGWGVLLAVWALAGGAALLQAAWRHGWREALQALGGPLAVAGAMLFWLLPALDDGQGVPVRGYGVMLLLAAAAGVGLSVVRGRRMGIDADTILALGMEIFLAGIVGARLFFVIEYWRDFFPPGRSLLQAIPAILNIPAGGLVVFGALPTAAVAVWWFARRRSLPLVVLADCMAPGLLVGLALGRLGCFLNGCCFGSPCELPWAVRFPPESPPWLDQINRGLLRSAVDTTGQRLWSLPIHPAQLYAALDASLLALLAVCFTPLARRDGEVFALVLTLHPISRFLLEMIRTDEPPALGTPFSISQLVSLVLLTLAVALWWWLSGQPLRGAPTAPSTASTAKPAVRL